MSAARSGYQDDQQQQQQQPKPREINRSQLLKAYEKKTINQDSHQQLLVTLNGPESSGTSIAKYHQFKKSHGRSVVAGSGMSETVKKLADETFFTGVHKQRLTERDSGENKRMSGTTKLLKSTPQLNMPRRSGDFRAELEWRLQLRPNLN
jgi:hypothetical protein